MNETPKLNDAVPEPKISQFEVDANRFIQNAAAMLVNGLRSSIPQAPVANLMVKLSSALGLSIGNVLSIGVLGDLLPLRKACIDAFTEGVRAVKIQPPPMQQNQPQKLNS